MPISKTVEIKNSILRTNQLLQKGQPIRLSCSIATSTNCYAYSLGIVFPGVRANGDYIPGFTEELEYETGNTEDLMDMIELDLQNLNIAFRRFSLEDKKSLKKHEYLVKVFYDNSEDDFHFIRQDKQSGIWFHKMGWYDQPELVLPIGDEPAIIHTCDCTYEPIGYFAITERKS